MIIITQTFSTKSKAQAFYKSVETTCPNGSVVYLPSTRCYTVLIYETDNYNKAVAIWRVGIKKGLTLGLCNCLYEKI